MKAANSLTYITVPFAPPVLITQQYNGSRNLWHAPGTTTLYVCSFIAISPTPFSADWYRMCGTRGGV